MVILGRSPNPLKKHWARCWKIPAPKKKSSEVEKIKINRLMREPVASVQFCRLTPQHIAKFRDDRLRSVSGIAALKDLSLLSHSITIAVREWGVIRVCFRGNTFGCMANRFKNIGKTHTRVFSLQPCRFRRYPLVSNPPNLFLIAVKIIQQTS
jgi:hypothetical protein